MAKKATPSARQAGANVGNAAPGATETGQNARRRRAAAGGSSTTTTSDRGLSVEQEDMERQREEFGAAERGSGDKPPAVHGRTRHVLDSASATDRIFTDKNPKPADDKRSVARAQDDVKRTRRVRAIKLGYYDDKRRRLGDVFLIRPPYTAKNTIGKEVPDKDDPTIRRTPETVTVDEFSDNWMEDVPGSTPLRQTTAAQDLKRKHDEELAARRTPKTDEDTGTGNQDVITAGT